MQNMVQAAYFSDNTLKKRPHYHDCHQLLLITKGQVTFCVNGASYEAKAGSVAIFSRYENHSVTLTSGTYERYVLHLSPTAASRENRLYTLLSNRPPEFRNILDVSGQLEEFTRLFARITLEKSEPQKMGEDMLQLLVSELLILICRVIPESTVPDKATADMVYEIQQRFENDFSRSYTLEALAKEYSVSPSSLSHQFKNVTGASVMGYLQSCRLASAKRYLTQTRLSISQIVERCGFSDCSNFSRTFRKQNGISPSAFRSRYS